MTPEHPRHAFCDSFYVELNDVLLDSSDIDDDEYEFVPVETTITWKLCDARGVQIADGKDARVCITSSLPGGPGLITSSGEYSISFAGSATYHLVNRETGEIQPCEEPVGLTPSTGGRLMMPFAFVGVESVSCEGVTSKIETPGVNETLVVPVGYNNGSLTVTASPDPHGEWPSGKPVWSGAAADAQNAAVATLSTATAGAYTVSATCGNTKGLTINIISFNNIKHKIGNSASWKDFDFTQKIKLGKHTWLKVFNQIPDNLILPEGIPTWSGTFGITGSGLMVEHTYSGNAATTDMDTKTVTTNYGPTIPKKFLVCNRVLGIHSNAEPDDGFTDGHAWISITTYAPGSPDPAKLATIGLWPDNHPLTHDNGSDTDVRFFLECIGNDGIVDFSKFEGKYNRYYLLSPSDFLALDIFIRREAHWSLFYTCANWAEDAVQNAVFEEVDSSDYVIFGTPRAISQSIVGLENENHTSREIPLFGGEDAPDSSSHSDNNKSSSFVD